MMNDYEKKLLTEVQLAIHEIEAVLGTTFSFTEMEDNALLVQAVGEELKIIGAVVSELNRMNSSFLRMNQRVVQVTRGIETDDGRITLDDITWVLQNDLPLLKEEVQQLLMQE